MAKKILSPSIINIISTIPKIFFKKNHNLVKIEKMTRDEMYYYAKSKNFSYKDPILKTLIWNIKFKRNGHCIKCGAYILYKKLIDKIELNKKDSNNIKLINKNFIILPVPVSIITRLVRGYNQTEELVKNLINLINNDSEKIFRSFDFEICFSLLKRKYSTAQKNLNKEQRKVNLNNKFYLDTKFINKLFNKNIIIIDDVKTTGSTLNEIKKTINSHNSAVNINYEEKIIGLVILN